MGPRHHSGTVQRGFQMWNSPKGVRFFTLVECGLANGPKPVGQSMVHCGSVHRLTYWVPGTIVVMYKGDFRCGIHTGGMRFGQWAKANRSIYGTYCGPRGVHRLTYWAPGAILVLYKGDLRCGILQGVLGFSHWWNVVWPTGQSQ